MSTPFDGYHDRYNEEVRLIILKALMDEPAGVMTDSMLEIVLEAFAVKRSREYIVTQMEWLETQAGAVKLTRSGTVTIAELTQTGENHVNRRAPITGVKLPSRTRS